MHWLCLQARLAKLKQTSTCDSNALLQPSSIAMCNVLSYEVAPLFTAFSIPADVQLLFGGANNDCRHQAVSSVVRSLNIELGASPYRPLGICRYRCFCHRHRASLEPKGSSWAACTLPAGLSVAVLTWLAPQIKDRSIQRGISYLALLTGLVSFQQVISNYRWKTNYRMGWFF